MKEYDELFEKFHQLGLNEKRNKYSDELIKIALILKNYLNQKNLDLFEMPHNYNKDQNLTESQMLDINFRDVYILKSELLLLLEALTNTNKGQ